MVRDFGLVTARDVDAIAEAWGDALALRPALRGAALAARGRLDRRRMIDEYRGAIAGLLLRDAIAA